MTWMIGIDTGGTFTDVIGMHRGTGELRTVKVPSTPRDPARAIVDGLQALMALADGFVPADISFFAHGTTVATNAVIERKGARTGLLITRGTNAVYYARQSRQPEGLEALDPDLRKPEPLVPLSRTCEVDERLAWDGSVLEPLDTSRLLAQVRTLVEAQGAESLAVCYLFSYMRDTHEQHTLQAIRSAFPGVRVSLSSALMPIIREYRRLSTTVLDAYVGPTLEGYLQRLDSGLRGIGLATRQVFIMQSNGGLMRIDVAAAHPVQTLLSGPAGGVLSGRYLGEITGFTRLITFDVGGTSTDVATLVDGVNAETTEGSVAGHDSAVPMNDIGTIGAGGGTIARVGGDGRLHVGPDSAGADPGPVCYGLGGTEPTVTDAALVLGYLDPGTALGGRVRIDRARAERAIAERIAGPLGIGVAQAAHGIVKIINSHMEGEIRLRLMARGLNPRDFALVALGGAGPMHAAMVARNLGFQAVLVPPYPGLGSAMGLLLTDIRHTYQQSRPGPLAGYDAEQAAAVFEALRDKAAAEARAEGTPPETLHCHELLALRYIGQGYELFVPCPGGRLGDEAARTAIAAAFHAQHAQQFGHDAPDTPIEIVHFRVDTVATLPRLRLPHHVPTDAASAVATPRTRRPVWFAESGGLTDTPVYLREALRSGARLDGPAIVEQADTTTVVLPGQRLEVDGHRNLVLRQAG